VSDVELHHGGWLAKQFGGRATSIFFPHLSPDGQRVFFKMSAPGAEGATGNFRSKQASDRQGLFVYELATGQPLCMRGTWGHPAWHPNGRTIIEVGYTLIDSDTGQSQRLSGLPPMGSGHPSFSPNGKLIVTDLTADRLGGRQGDWAVIVCDARGGSHVVLRQFDNSQGANSWRKNHPHPVFSADGRRIYFNVNAGEWTQLYVAECSQPADAATP
jgi:Tol biopolymer transport system component